jgi:hypothetical protein
MQQDVELNIGIEDILLPIELLQSDEKKPDTSKFTILLVEDNKDILNYIQHELQGKYFVLKAINVAHIIGYSSRLNFSVIFRDI